MRVHIESKHKEVISEPLVALLHQVQGLDPDWLTLITGCAVQFKAPRRAEDCRLIVLSSLDCCTPGAMIW